MKYNIEQLIHDEEIKKILYILEDVDSCNTTKEEGLVKIENIRLQNFKHTDDAPYEIMYTLINDYKNDILDIQSLKGEIFSLLEEFQMVKRVV